MCRMQLTKGTAAVQSICLVLLWQSNYPKFPCQYISLSSMERSRSPSLSIWRTPSFCAQYGCYFSVGSFFNRDSRTIETPSYVVCKLCAFPVLMHTTIMSRRGSPTASLPPLHGPLCPTSKCSSDVIMPTHWLPHHSQEAHASRLILHCFLVPLAFTSISCCLCTLSRSLALAPCLWSSPPSLLSGAHQLMVYTIFQRLWPQRRLPRPSVTFLWCNFTDKFVW